MRKLTIVAIILMAFVAVMVAAQDKPAEKPKEAAAAAHAFVGADKCKMCHKAEFDAWSKTKHAKAFEALKPEEQKKAECVICHTTGKTAEAVELNGVQCEACHGAGADYKKPTIMNAAKWKADSTAQFKLMKEAGLTLPVEADCMRCHKQEGNPNFKPFDFAKMHLLVHPIAAAAPAPAGK
ncbi:MAG TPA: cytochrome c family protein [Candidatus Acidoferrum sp.]|nr:cytochrome c family protein [Candidatus Acidoferrum sp.]